MSEFRLLAFMVERENIRLRRECGYPYPWTDDRILQDYKFTNVKRKHDRVSKEFESWYQAHPKASGRQIVYNAAFARYFGRPEFVISAGWQRTHNPENIVPLAREWLDRGGKVFTGAYMITNLGRLGPKEEFVVNDVLSEVWERAPKIASIIKHTQSWGAAHAELSKCLGFGGTGFMGKEVLLDTMYTDLWEDKPADWGTWCPVGPGALRGLNRLAERPKQKGLTQAKALSELIQVWNNIRLLWPSGWEPLDLHDVQFQLCEFDKYERARLGEGRPRGRYHPPKETTR